MKKTEFILANIIGAKNICEMLKPCLGPSGMYKMIYDKFGAIVITNDGSRILRDLEQEFSNPVARIFVECARAQDAEIGDGTKSVIILAGELLSKAAELITKGVHPIRISEGYKIAAKKAVEIYESLSITKPTNNVRILRRIALTALSSKIMDKKVCEKFADIATNTILRLVQASDPMSNLDLENIKFARIKVDSLLDSSLFNGIVIDKGMPTPEMPKVIKNAKIAVINVPLKIRKEVERERKIEITQAGKMKNILTVQRKLLAEKIDRLLSLRVNFVASSQEIDDLALSLMSKKNLAAVDRIENRELIRIAKAVGANIVSDIDEMTNDDLGFSEVIREESFGDDKMTFIKGHKDSIITTIVIKGSFIRMLEEAEVAFRDALLVLMKFIAENKVVAGGGATEIEVASRLRDLAFSYNGIAQITMQKFSEALESIPMTLAKNSGLDPIEALTRLRFLHQKGKRFYGVDSYRARIANMIRLGIFDSLAVKKHMIKSAIEMVSLILKSDEAIFKTLKNDHNLFSLNNI